MAQTKCERCGVWIYHDDSNDKALENHNKEVHPEEPEKKMEEKD